MCGCRFHGTDTRCLPFCAFSSNNPLTTDSKLGISELFDKFQSTGKATECLALPGLDLSRKVLRSYKSYRYYANGQLARLFQFFRPLNLPFRFSALGTIGDCAAKPWQSCFGQFRISTIFITVWQVWQVPRCIQWTGGADGRSAGLQRPASE